jgi:type 1 fimbriae regulatory protein FimB/type 1 fimbriae regulatory protein FimE
LTPAEVEKLMPTARSSGRCGHRDASLVLIAYRHGLRASEIADLEWSQLEFGRAATLHVRRAKNGKPSAHPLRGDEVRALRELRRQFPNSAFVFATEHGGPFTPDAINRLVKRIGERAGLAFPVHVHMLRHACGYALANAGHDTRANPGLARPPQHPAYREVYRTFADAVPGFLARLSAIDGGHEIGGRENFADKARPSLPQSFGEF